jgi:hypothetical protein
MTEETPGCFMQDDTITSNSVQMARIHLFPSEWNVLFQVVLGYLRCVINAGIPFLQLESLYEKIIYLMPISILHISKWKHHFHVITTFPAEVMFSHKQWTLHHTNT